MELQEIQNRIFTIRGLRVMMDFHLAELYDVETRVMNQAVRRNLKRFPADFMFQLTDRELAAIKAEMTVSETEMNSSQIVMSSQRGRKYLPFAFTEQGVAMLSSVLKSDRAIDVNIAIMRAFVILRRYLMNYEELSKRIDALEKEMNREFKDIHEALNYLLDKDAPREIGFRQSGHN